MNLESNSQCVVTSKYFECRTVMDESLSDFQENKQNHKGPKVNQKATKPKHKKVIKKIKGQKDIRTALKKESNDLVSYAKEFDNVCKKSGVDVDSEQLQLAIALSKSLQTDDSDASTSQSLTSKGRLAKIRTTLQEYGFRVPAPKISTNKKLNKGRKAYKLITITEEERHQKVIGKYAEVLLGCFDSSKLNENCSYNNIAPNFHLVSNCPYEFMRDNNIFYVDNLLEKSSSSGYMLRDWAEIPGRPVSPLIFDNSRMDFRELSCSQNELDTILSSSIKSAQNIVAIKIKPPIKRQIYDIIENEDVNNEANKIKNCDNEDCIVNNQEIHLSNKYDMKSHDKDSTSRIEIIHLESNSSFINNDQNRCVSPDLFEDDVSYVIPCPSTIITPTKSLSQGQNTKIFTESINSLDFTDFANNSYHNIEKPHLLTSQNKTKRKSDDFMDLTQCAVSASQGIQKETQIDLTKNPDKEVIKLGATLLPDLNISPKEDTSTKTTILNYKDNKYTKDTHISNNESTLYIVNEDIENVEECLKVSMCMNNRNKMIEDTITISMPNDVIDLTQSYKEEKNISITSQTKGSDDELECMDLTQSSRSSACLDELPEIELDNTKGLHSNVNDTIILKEEEYISINDNAKTLITVQDNQVFDLTQDLDELAKQDDQDKNVLSFYDDFVHDHSDTKENTQNNLVTDRVHSTNEEIVCIDGVQSPSSMANRPISDESIIKATSSSSLGKRDDNISIDYDEICEYVRAIQSNVEESLDKEKHDSVKSQISNDVHQYNSCHDPDLSQQSEIFDLTDKELDYSLHKSKYDNMFVDCNLDFGGISVMDNNITGINTAEYIEKRNSYVKNTSMIRKSCASINVKTLEEKSMNPTELNGDNPCTISPSEIKDPFKSNFSTDTLLTPNNNEYLVKRNEITPMLDYELMTTPQRNKELDKYGLRPFKRKRAIQILTHLYNQTHPVIESYLDKNQPSPSKKSKLVNEPSCSSPKKLKSPRKPVIYENKSPRKETIIRKSKSPRKSSENNSKENSPRKNRNMLCTYEISSEVPFIKCLDCNPEDWVFQKKEKAKVHSCRVPLHITFHNYVSSRRSLREAILKYEPVNIDVIHKELVSYGYRYDPKDLLRFLDKKCITVKTADNNARNKR